MIRILFISLALYLSFSNLYAQQKVSFYSEDSLRITADLYLKDYELPFILLFHQGSSSRGEFSEIAVRLMKLDYNCLAVDLRTGDKMNYISNETAARAKAGKYRHSMLDARKDIEAALQYIRKFNKKPVILFGSSFSASLCLIEAVNNPNVKAVIAFSPGEFFRPEVSVKDSIGELRIPLFIYATAMESEFVQQMLEDIPGSFIQFYSPSSGKGEHGAKTLWQTNSNSDESWFELMLFFKKIRY
jgi:pimeloyl-ACP methyl ester carboxylesterase